MRTIDLSQILKDIVTEAVAVAHDAGKESAKRALHNMVNNDDGLRRALAHHAVDSLVDDEWERMVGD